jgi:hemerythrin superfamily protein
MDAIELIKKDHERVNELFTRYNGGGTLTGLVRRMTGNGVSSRQKRTTLQTICRELDVHARVEEEIFYPAVRATGDPELAKQLDEAFREHAGVKEQIASLRATPDADDVDERVSKLQGDVDHHVREEENEMLPRVEDLIPESERAALGRRMQGRKRALGGAPRKAASARRTATRRATRTAKTRTATAKRRVRKPATKAKRARTKTRRRRAV